MFLSREAAFGDSLIGHIKLSVVFDSRHII